MCSKCDAPVRECLRRRSTDPSRRRDAERPSKGPANHRRSDRSRLHWRSLAGCGCGARGGLRRRNRCEFERHGHLADTSLKFQLCFAVFGGPSGFRLRKCSAVIATLSREATCWLLASRPLPARHSGRWRGRSCSLHWTPNDLCAFGARVFIFMPEACSRPLKKTVP